MTDTKERVKTYLQYIGLIERVERVFAKITMNQFVANDPFATIIEKIYVHGPKFLEFITESRGQEYGLAKNAVDTAVLSLGIARAMKLADLDVTCNTLLIRLLAS